VYVLTFLFVLANYVLPIFPESSLLFKYYMSFELFAYMLRNMPAYSKKSSTHNYQSNT